MRPLQRPGALGREQLAALARAVAFGAALSVPVVVGLAAQVVAAGLVR